MALRAKKVSGDFEKQALQDQRFTRIMVRQKTDENTLDKDLLLAFLMHHGPSEFVSLILIQIISKERN